VNSRRSILRLLVFLAAVSIAGIVATIATPVHRTPCRTYACGQPAAAPGTPGLTP
jgi:hypothetical protein